MTGEAQEPEYEPLEFAARYYVQTAQNSIESLPHIVEEIGSNEDEAITRRATRDGTSDAGRITFSYNPEMMRLEVTGDGAGMSSDAMRSRLKHVGHAPQVGSRRGFFHRGVREVFLAMGGGDILSIGITSEGNPALSHAVFKADKGMAIIEDNRVPTSDDRAALGLLSTGTRVRVPLERFAMHKPRLYEFSSVEAQIRDCVGLRPVLTDPNREVALIYGQGRPRTLRFEYPEGEDLIALRPVTIAGHVGTLWVKVAPKQIKGGRSRRMRRNGILIRGERAAYEASLGEKLRNHPAMSRIFGELRIDAIETLQREATDESQLIYKTDRSGLNPEHPFVESLTTFLDDVLGPLVANIDASDRSKQVSPDMRRQLQRLAREINHVLKDEPLGTVSDTGGEKKAKAEKEPSGQEPPEPPDDRTREVADGIAFAHARIFMEAGRSRTIKVWFDVGKILPGTTVNVTSPPDEVVQSATLARGTVPDPGADGIAELALAIRAGALEGRHELVVEAGGYAAPLPVHVRFPRASGFISQIIPEDTDWEAGSALWDPATGVVRVFVGRPEFKDAAARAKADKEPNAWKHPLYRQLVVESVREAALWPAAARRAEVDWDELPFDERQDSNGFYRLVQTEFQELDYLLRSKLLKVFVEL